LKSILAFLCLMGFFVNPVFSQFHPGVSQETFQGDSAISKGVIIKINPSLIATGVTTNGEYGVIIQFPIKRTRGQNGIFKNMDAYIGGGYDQNFDSYTAATQPNGTGYTIRGGIYCYRKKKKYVSFQFFYRRWDIKSIYETEAEQMDNIIDPSTFLGSTYDADHSEVLYFENAKVSVYTVDIVYGKQYRPKGNRGGLFFEWFIGAGMRYKIIDIDELGDYNSLTILGYGITPGTYQPFNTPIHTTGTSIYPDMKLGFMIGFIL